MTDTLRAVRMVAAMAAMFCVFGNVQAPAWFGVAFLTEQHFALGLSLCALLLSVLDGLPRTGRACLLWRGLFLWRALDDTLVAGERVHLLMRQHNAGTSRRQVIGEAARATVAPVKDAVRE